MDPTKLNDYELADLAANIVNLLNGPELSSIEPGLRSNLIAAFGTKPAEFASQLSMQAVAENQRQAATSAKNMTRGELIPLIRMTKYALKASAAPRAQFDLARFSFPEGRSGEYFAQTPGEMSAVGFSNGVNSGRFVGNNRNGAVVYEIWRRKGRDGEWTIHILTTRQDFRDEGVTPGLYYEYRVRARAKKNVSDFSNSTIVYGVM